MSAEWQLVVQVQVDRLPDVPAAGGRHVQLGLKLVAALRPAPPPPLAPAPAAAPAALPAADEPDPAALSTLLLPWRWRSRTTPTVAFDPHDPAAWTLWRVKSDQTVQEVPHATPAGAVVSAAAEVPAGFDPGDRLEGALGSAVERAVGESGLAALVEPAAGAELTGATVFGLVDSLSALPAPAPAGLGLWTALSIDTTHFPIAEDDRFLAAPAFTAPDAVACTPAGPPTESGPVAGRWECAYTTAPAGARGAVAVIEPSLSFADLAAAAGTLVPLIDLRSLTVAKGDGLSGEDWAATLAERLADAVDPAARTLAVLDATVRAACAADPATAAAVLADAGRGGGDYLRGVLGRVVASVLAPRDRGAQPPAAVALEAAAATDPLVRTTAARLAVAHTLAIAGGSPWAETPFAAVSRARLAALAGAAGSAGDDFSAGPDDPADLETADRLAAWIAAHWTGQPPAIDAAKGTRLVAERRESHVRLVDEPAPADPAGAPPPAQKGWVVRTTVARSGVLDLAALAAAGATPLSLAFRLREMSRPLSLVVGLTPEAPLEVALKVDSDDNAELSVGGGAPETAVVPGDDLGLELLLDLAAGAGGTRAHIRAVLTGNDNSRLEANAAASVAVPAGRLGLVVEVTEGRARIAADVGQVSGRLVATLAAGAGRHRAALALVHAGPATAALIAGYPPIDGQAVSPEDLREPIGVRLPAAATTYVTTHFSDVFAAAMAAAAAQAEATAKARAVSEGIPEPEHLQRGPLARWRAHQQQLVALVTAVRDAAIANAIRLAGRLVPAGGGPDDLVSEDAPPVAFVFDQLQDFDDREDWWTRLAGLGVLIARADPADSKSVPARWWSLNAATLHAPVAVDGLRALLSETNAVAVRAAATWTQAALVDPVPLPVGEIDGVRTASVRYDNQSIVAEMASAPKVDPHQSATGPRRPEAYFFPNAADFPKLMATTFGREVCALPYLVGHGGALPPFLREAPLRPAAIKRTRDAAGALTLDPVAVAPFVRRASYLRTVPVGPPRLLPGDAPSVPAGVNPLAGELPLCPPPITLIAGRPVRFFVDKAGRGGTLDAPPGRDAATTVIRIEIGRLTLGPADALEITAARGSLAQAETVLRAVVTGADLAAAGIVEPCGLRLDAMGVDVWVAALLPGRLADDPAVAVALDTAVNPALTLPPAQWRGVHLSFAGGVVAIEPPGVHFGSLAVPGGDVVLDGDRPLFPDESPHRARSTTVLDGIKLGSPTGPRRLRLSLARPAVPFATFERWVNGPLSGWGTMPAKTARDGLDAAHRRTTRATDDRADRSLDDPAVERLFVEVVAMFPRRAVVVPVRPLGGARAAADGLVLHGTPIARLELDADLTTGVAPGSATVTELAGGAAASAGLRLGLAPSSVFEVRVYGGVPAAQPVLSPIATRTRFGAAASAGFRMHGDWWLTTPQILTIEVASERMPELYGRGLAVLRLDGVLAGRGMAVGLSPTPVPVPVADEADWTDRRMVDRIALVEQQWGWRGRPMPSRAPGGTEAFDQIDADTALAGFIDACFLDRAGEDARIFREAAVGLPQWRGKAPVLTRPIDPPAGGTLWRFALRATSRYAAMRPAEQRLVRFTHRDDTDRSEKFTWTRFAVPVHPQGLPPRPARPGFALVLPLTEPMVPGGVVPPLLAVFDEPLFPHGNAGDGIEAMVETARHPFTAHERMGAAWKQRLEAAWASATAAGLDEAARRAANGTLAWTLAAGTAHGELEAWEDLLAKADPKDEALTARLRQAREDAHAAVVAAEAAPVEPKDERPLTVAPDVKYLPEFGPDPVRTGAAADGTPVALRVDGPIGYGFDAGVEAGRFDHAGLLITPIAPAVRPWSFAKLRFRRCEVPELMSDAAGRPLRRDVTMAPGTMMVLRPACNGATAEDGGACENVVAFATDHQGVCLDLTLPAELPEGGLALRFAFAKPAGGGFVRIAIGLAEDAAEAPRRRLTLTGATDRGPAAPWTLAIDPAARATLRLVLSLRPAAPDGAAEPAGDIVVRLHLSRGAVGDGMLRAEEDAWLTVLTLPLVGAAPEVGDPTPPLVSVAAEGTDIDLGISPIRLSDFTPGVWCQFAAAMSTLVLTATEGTGATARRIASTVSVEGLAASLVGAGATARLRLAPMDARPDVPLTDIALAAPGAPDPASQLEERLHLVVTRYATDAFDRLRERPIAVYALPPDGRLDGAALTWPAMPAALTGRGRVRVLRTLSGKPRSEGGFETERPRFPADFFGGEADDGEPADAAGQVLGISAPVEWTA
jgi:hypothetical protein